MSAIEGLDELFAKLDGLDENMLSNAAAALQRGALLIAGDAKARVQPISHEVANSITTQVDVSEDSVEAQVLETKDFGIFIEMGTGPRGEAKHEGVSPELLAGTTYRSDAWTYYDEKHEQFVRTEGQPARPYMYPAYLANREDVQREVGDSIKDGLKEV